MASPLRNLAREILIRRSPGSWTVSQKLENDLGFPVPDVAGATREQALELLRQETGISELELEDIHPAVSPADRAEFWIDLFAAAHDEIADGIDADMAAIFEGEDFADTRTLPHVLPARLAQFCGLRTIAAFKVELNVVAAKLALYLENDEAPYLASTAEELAALALITEAKALLAETISFSQRLGVDGDDDDNPLTEVFNLVIEMADMVLVQPHAGLLFSDMAATVDYPFSPLFQIPGAEFLDPAAWFEPFMEDEDGLGPIDDALAGPTLEVIYGDLYRHHLERTAGREGEQPGLLDGLLTCGDCGGPMMRVGDEYVCTGEAPVMQ